jgi:hypothetical protein
MRRPWKSVAECADNVAFEIDEIREAILPAIENDCRREVRREFLDSLCGACADQEAMLFRSEMRHVLEGLRRTANAGLEQQVLEHAIHAAASGSNGHGVAETALARALKDRGASGIKQVEEHYLRKSSAKRAHNVRDRMEKAVAGADIDQVVRRLVNGKQKNPAPQLSKRQGLDDGVRL